MKLTTSTYSRTKSQFDLDAYQKTPITVKLTNLSTQPEERQEWGKDAYYRAVFSFDNVQKLNILPGMTGRVRLQGGQIE